MNNESLTAALERFDEQLIRENVPVRARPFAALSRLFPEASFPMIGREQAIEHGEWSTANVAWKVNDWFRDRYGDKLLLECDLGRVPVLIRGEIYIARVPIAWGTRTKIDPMKFIEGLTDGLKSSLQSHEWRTLAQDYVEAFRLVYELDDARGQAAGRGHEELLVKAIHDRDAATHCLERIQDTNGCCVHAQQHAEKTLKFFLTEKAGYTEAKRRSLSHKLRRTLARCAEVLPAFEQVGADIDVLQRVTMDFRYSKPAVSQIEAVRTLWAALRVGGFAACAALDLERRALTSELNVHWPEGVLTAKRRSLIETSMAAIRKCNSVAVSRRHDATVVAMLDLRDDCGKRVAAEAGYPVEQAVEELSEPGNHRRHNFALVGLTPSAAIRAIAMNRTTPIDDGLLAGPRPDRMTVVFVSDDSYECFEFEGGNNE